MVSLPEIRAACGPEGAAASKKRVAGTAALSTHRRLVPDMACSSLMRILAVVENAA
jgi:hypothetical protein